jgi:plastocyanin
MRPVRFDRGALVALTLLLAGIAWGRADGPDQVAPAVVEGVVSYDGPVPKPVPVVEANAVRHLVELDAKTKGLKEAVVWIEGAKAPQGRKPPAAARMDQSNYFFVPHVLAVEAGQEVEFTNSDGANHGVLGSSSEPKNCFNVLTPPGGSARQSFVACRQPVAIGCPLHAGMAAYVFVFDHPFFAVTDARGRFRLPPLPPGRYTLVVRHVDGELERRVPLTVEAGKAVTLTLALTTDDLKGRK